MMNQPETLVVLSLVKTVRRTMRVLNRLEEAAVEDDLKRKFSQFSQEHQRLLDHLKQLADLEAHTSSNTPEAVIQFPINREELLKMAAKSEKQVVDEMSEVITAKITPTVTKILKKHKSHIIASYDYLQALHDLNI
ncbi:MAG: hypothetical protein AAF846_27870 [Chloroflexota bacterium]